MNFGIDFGYGVNFVDECFNEDGVGCRIGGVCCVDCFGMKSEWMLFI